MEIHSLEHAQQIIALLTQQRESISNSYVSTLAQAQQLAAIAQAQGERIEKLETLLKKHEIDVPGEGETVADEPEVQAPVKVVKKKTK
jgi:hypothetical protein